MFIEKGASWLDVSAVQDGNTMEVQMPNYKL